VPEHVTHHNATTADPANAGYWRGRSLGSRTVVYDVRDAILYALAVGASAHDLDLVFEERLRVLPTFALTLAQWAPDVLASAKAFDSRRALHVSQRLAALKPLPPSAEVTMASRVTEVWDKQRAAIFEVEVTSDYFAATWSIFAPGSGGFGGARGPARTERPDEPPDWRTIVRTSPNQAALYRLLGDRHRIHIDPAAAGFIGAPRPILHGLCTLAASTFAVAEAAGAHPADLTTIEGRFDAPVLPGDDLEVRGWAGGRFEVASAQLTVVSTGVAHFA